MQQLKTRLFPHDSKFNTPDHELTPKSQSPTSEANSFSAS